MPSGGKICVVVESMTRAPFFDSSRAIFSISVVFPPPPTSAMMPRKAPSMYDPATGVLRPPKKLNDYQIYQQ